MEHIPDIRLIDKHRRSRLLSRGYSLHVSLPPDCSTKSSKKVKRTHLHLMLGSKGQTKTEIIPSYNRAIVVEFETRKLRDLGVHQISSTKFSFGSTIFKPKVIVFCDTEYTRNTMWCLSRPESAHSHSVHEALRRFFCLQGHVPFEVGTFRFI